LIFDQNDEKNLFFLKFFGGGPHGIQGLEKLKVSYFYSPYTEGLLSTRISLGMFCLEEVRASKVDSDLKKGFCLPKIGNLSARWGTEENREK